YVTSLRPELLLEAMSFVVDLHQDASVLEIFEVRRILEPAAAIFAVDRISEDTLDELAAGLDEVSEDTPIEELVQHDLAFHHTITAAGGNAYLTSLLDALSSSTARARVWRGITQDRAVARTLAEHERILQALRARDKEMVRAALTVHIGGVDSWLRQAVEDSESVPPAARAADGLPGGTVETPTSSGCATRRARVNAPSPDQARSESDNFDHPGCGHRYRRRDGADDRRAPTRPARAGGHLRGRQRGPACGGGQHPRRAGSGRSRGRARGCRCGPPAGGTPAGRLAYARC